MENCIEFQGCKNKYGYGVKNSGGKLLYAHRLAYCKSKNLDIKEIDGLFVMHTCDNPLCVNPAHLILGRKMGEAHERAKLTSDDVFKIREMVKFKTKKEVARLFLISQSHVNNIVSRRIWAHLPEQQSIDE